GRGALERHVFKQVGDTVFCLALRACARLYPHAQGRAFQVRHVVGQHHHAIVECSRLHAQTNSPEPLAGPATVLLPQPARLRDEMKRSLARWSLADTVTGAGRSDSSPSHSGNVGSSPETSATAAGNFAGDAVPRATMGTVDASRARSTSTTSAV